ncbi:MAG: YraN family protein [Hyphomicrobiales bacterium]|nr:YraN family protein [Hyphomicrobiales bacterium]
MPGKPKQYYKEKRQAAYLLGILGEWVVLLLLLLKGYHIRARRYRCPVGEVDMIAFRGRTIIFVEVKTRHRSEDAAELPLSATQRRRISRAAAMYIAKHPEFATFNVRFDLVVVRPWCWPRFYRNAWMEETQ